MNRNKLERLRKQGKCNLPNYSNIYFHCPDCCVEADCDDDTCPWHKVCIGKDCKQCKEYIPQGE